MSLRNLAGADPEKVDYECRRELFRACIPIVEVPRAVGEVRATVEGKLGQFRFTRAWRYWVVTGNMPLEIAELIYEDPVGAEDIRADGHCGCINPRDACVHIGRSGKILADPKELYVLNTFEDEDFKKKVSTEFFKNYEISEHPSLDAVESVVQFYHIDSEVGLRMFSQYARLSWAYGGIPTRVSL